MHTGEEEEASVHEKVPSQREEEPIPEEAPTQEGEAPILGEASALIIVMASSLTSIIIKLTAREVVSSSIRTLMIVAVPLVSAVVSTTSAVASTSTLAGTQLADDTHLSPTAHFNRRIVERTI
ncbi:uncharacterized protein A4U43_C04F29890 [Asparagus officinalis]|uniref:Uncharacterized protein n=1 Tax=Asparagus officinalis TaxID=4686 RepID=A0A5P1F4N3_ASPOF|nr:uncharacterized protein A4U43_C04F29890 [Asparagus officinalis]